MVGSMRVMLHEVEGAGRRGGWRVTVVLSGDQLVGGWEGGVQVVEEQWMALSQLMDRECSRILEKGGESKVNETGERKEAMGVLGEWDVTVG